MDKMIKIIVCEDNEKSLLRTVEIINKTLLPKDIEYRTLKFEGYNSKLQNEIDNTTDQKIYILDIEMPEVSGLEIASKIRETDWESLIIFLTAHNQYKADVFYSRLMALDYICKQVTYEQRLTQTLECALQAIDKKKVLIFEYNRTTYRVPYKDILYIEKLPMSKKCVIITEDDNEFEIPTTMQELSAQLGEQFYQTHQSCIVNLDKVKNINYGEGIITLINDDEITYLSNSLVNTVL